PHIVWAITAHGGCLGLTHPRIDSPPTITLHPSILGGTQKKNPWGIDPAFLGTCYAFDVLLHESTHVSVAYRLGGWRGKGSTSHNNEVWIAEVNRLMPLLGLNGGTAGRNKTRRVVAPDADPNGPKTRVIRASDGTLPHMAVATFPYGARCQLTDSASYYRAG